MQTNERSIKKDLKKKKLLQNFFSIYWYSNKIEKSHKTIHQRTSHQIQSPGSIHDSQ